MGTFVAIAPGAPEIRRPENASPYTLAFEIDQQNGLQPSEFLVGGTATPVAARHILPYDKLKEIAVYFLETGERDPKVSWEMI